MKAAGDTDPLDLVKAAVLGGQLEYALTTTIQECYKDFLLGANWDLRRTEAGVHAVAQPRAGAALTPPGAPPLTAPCAVRRGWSDVGPTVCTPERQTHSCSSPACSQLKHSTSSPK